MSRQRLVRSMASLAIVVGTATAAAAQDAVKVPAAPGNRVIDLSMSYSVLRDSSSDQTLPAAWVASAGLWSSNRFAFVGEASGSYKTLEMAGGNLKYRVHAFMGGVRATAGARGRITPFGQALVGAACFCGSTRSTSGFTTGLAWQLGGGMDYGVTRRLGVRVQGDFRRVHDEGLSFNQFRVAFGAVVGLMKY